MPSMTRKIQTSAATLMMSGTVTKNPVMKRRRSQDHMSSVNAGRDSHTATAAASARRYHANTASECDARYRRKYLIVR